MSLSHTLWDHVDTRLCTRVSQDLISSTMLVCCEEKEELQAVCSVFCQEEENQQAKHDTLMSSELIFSLTVLACYFTVPL